MTSFKIGSRRREGDRIRNGIGVKLMMKMSRSRRGDAGHGVLVEFVGTYLRMLGVREGKLSAVNDNGNTVCASCM